MENQNTTGWDDRLTSVVPSRRQLAHQEMEFYAFFHYTINTYTGREWGDGTESPSLFAPSRLNPGQWARAVKAAGMKGAILTCKHHDGFCLWPSKYTSHTVAASPYKNGRGDVVAEVAAACREEGIKFGIYLSPWDRNQSCYGQGKAYDDYFVNQLTELLTGYGDIFCVWLDGACGEGKNGKVQHYDWARYYETIRRLQPEACISVTGPDVRWCGNEAAQTREEEWSVVPARLFDPQKIQENSQQEDNAAFRKKRITSSDEDLGSRKALAGEENLIWYPAEVDVSIRPGWFYHPEEDCQVRSPEELLEIYDRSVGGNGLLLLNIPPTPEGLVHRRDEEVLRELGKQIKARQAKNLSESGRLKTGVRDGAYFARIAWQEPQEISFLVLQEDIRWSQRVEEYVITDGETGTVFYEGRVIGYKKHISLPKVRVKSLQLTVLKSRGEVRLRAMGCY